MTLILAAMNSDFIVQVTDRRLTSGGAVVDDEYEKCFSLALPGFLFSVAFTGLAKVGTHSTKTWLMENICDLATPEPVALLDGLATKLTQLFNDSTSIKQLRPSDKSLVVSFVGYNLTDATPKGIAGQIYNTADQNGPFVVRHFSLKHDAPTDWTWVGMFGSGRPAAVQFEARIRERLQAGTPPNGMQAMMEKMVREAASDLSTAETVGKQLDSITLYSDPTQPIQGGGSTMANQNHVRMPSAVVIQPDGSGVAITDFTIEDVSDEPRPMVVPKAHRNAPCPCGSGKRYKECHGDKKLQQPAPILSGLPGSKKPYQPK